MLIPLKIQLRYGLKLNEITGYLGSGKISRIDDLQKSFYPALIIQILIPLLVIQLRFGFHLKITRYLGSGKISRIDIFKNPIYPA
jgi:hypothetical protein